MFRKLKKLFSFLTKSASQSVLNAIVFDLRAFGVLTSSAGFAAYLVDLDKHFSSLIILFVGGIIWIIALVLTNKWSKS